MPTGRYTSLSSWLSSGLEVLEAAGYDCDQLLRDTGVDIRTTRAGQDRTPIEDIGAVWRLAAEVTGDSTIGIRAAQQYFSPAYWQSLGLAILCSNTLRKALHRMVKYFEILSDAASISLEEGETEIVFVARMRASANELGFEALEFGLASLLALFRSVYPGHLIPLEIRLVRPLPDNAKDFEQLFDCPVVFGSSIESISFDIADADKKLPGGNQQLASYQDLFSEEYIGRYGHNSITLKVKDEILRLLPGGDPSQAVVAEALHTSSRNLQRKLRSENTSFREILSEIRMKLAQSYLAQNRNSYVEVAYLLGFADQSNFARAFKQWFDMSPSQYRKEVLNRKSWESRTNRGQFSVLS